MRRYQHQYKFEPATFSLGSIFMEIPGFADAARASLESQTKLQEEKAKVEEERKQQKTIDNQFELNKRLVTLAARPSLATLMACKIKRDSSKPDLVADNNVDPVTAVFLERAGFRIVHINKTNMEEDKDEAIFTYVREHGYVLVTHDKDFLDTSRFDLETSPGIIILPANNEGLRGKSHNPENNKMLQQALFHFLRIRPSNIAGYHGHIFFYDIHGQLDIHKPPYCIDNAHKLSRSHNSLCYSL